MAWRDDAALAAMGLVHAAGTEAMIALEQRLERIGVADAMISSDRVARDFVRSAIRDGLRRDGDAWFERHARALRRVDARLEPLALRFSAMGTRPPLPQDEAPVPATWRAPSWLRDPVISLGAAMEWAAAEAANRSLPRAMRDGAGQVSARIGYEIGERSGAYERVRVAGRAELSGRWIGPEHADSAPRPYLTQLLDTVDQVASKAMETIA